MNIFLFICGILIYVCACELGIRAYFSIAVYMHQHLPKVIAPVLLLIWLAFFAVMLILAFLFPAWLSEKLVVFERSEISTGILILFGGVVLVTTLWRGWLSKQGRQFKAAFQ